MIVIDIGNKKTYLRFFFFLVYSCLLFLHLVVVDLVAGDGEVLVGLVGSPLVDVAALVATVELVCAVCERGEERVGEYIEILYAIITINSSSRAINCRIRTGQ